MVFNNEEIILEIKNVSFKEFADSLVEICCLGQGGDVHV